MDAKETLECVDWNHVVQGSEKLLAVVKAVMNCRVALNAENFLNS
jgi:hypothetical protein